MFFQFRQHTQSAPFVFVDPAIGDVLDRQRVQIVQLLAAAPNGDHKSRRFEQLEVLGYRLPRHVEVFAKLSERLTVVRSQLIEQLPATGIGQSLEHLIHVGRHEPIMQPFGCMSSPLCRTRICRMLFMIIEHFRNRDPRPVRERFLCEGRLLPEGVVYHASWIDAPNARCYQVMEAPDRSSIEAWIARWNDLVEFEVIPVVTSQDYWTKFAGDGDESPTNGANS